MTRVLVAGASGFLGRFVAREFKERDDWVRVLARQPDRLTTPGPFLEPAMPDVLFEAPKSGNHTLRASFAGVAPKR